MNLRTMLALVVFLGACRSPEGALVEDGSWVGSVATDGNVTTVVSESGSVWGGTATLVEEASIGVEAGDEPYLLGSVRGIAADRDRIYVLDSQIPLLRVYDHDGLHLFDIGAEGEGPGEYRSPDSVAVGPDGRIYVRVFPLQRINVYEPDGTDLPPLSSPERLHQGAPLRVLQDGVVYATARGGYVGLAADNREVPFIERPTNSDQRFIVRTAGIPGWMSPWETIVPFAPGLVSRLSPAGALASGFSEDYRIEIRFLDGTSIVIERVTEPVVVEEAERAWHDEYFRTDIAQGGPVEGSIPPSPETKPFFENFLPTHDGRIWVVRPGRGEREIDCAPFGVDIRELRQRPCWRDTRIVDAFEIDGGRYLGEIDYPAGLRTNPQPHIDGDLVVGVYEDDDGTIMVKRYRLVLPGRQ